MLELDIVDGRGDDVREDPCANHVVGTIIGIKVDKSIEPLKGPNRVVPWDYGMHLPMWDLEGM
jgi:hypothetical protein